MVRPSEEMLIFTRIIRPYLKNVISGNIPKVVFEENTPIYIIEKFNSIKKKIGYEIYT